MNRQSLLHTTIQDTRNLVNHADLRLIPYLKVAIFLFVPLLNGMFEILFPKLSEIALD